MDINKIQISQQQDTQKQEKPSLNKEDDLSSIMNTASARKGQTGNAFLMYPDGSIFIR